MPTVTTRPIVDELPPDATLHLAFDLGNTEWSLACAPAVAAAPRVRTMPARDLPRLVTSSHGVRGGPTALQTAPGGTDSDVLRSRT